jgi:predicted alpha/beta hydrolase
MSGSIEEPVEWMTFNAQHSRYQGRDFYGERADDLAELHYLRDWQRWARREIKTLRDEIFTLTGGH